MFVPDHNLKDLVVSYLREQERSISALTKQLRADGYPFHRLFVTGYLKALADAGILREKDIPPAKVYSTSAHREPNLYELVGSRCADVPYTFAGGMSFSRRMPASARAFRYPVTKSRWNG